MNGEDGSGPVWALLGAYPEVMTSAEVAAVMRLTRQTVCKAAARGELKGFRVGRSWRFFRHDVAAAMCPALPVEGNAPSA